ncbi:unnamed protein product [Peronospora effusa]|nr:unnamed protein product [Peronospora effusa]
MGGRDFLLHGTKEVEEEEDDDDEELAGAETTSKEFFPSDVTRFVLSNVAIGKDDQDLVQYQELPASGIYVMDLRATKDTLLSYRMEFHPYAPIVPKLPLTIPKPEAPSYMLDRFGCKFSCPTTTGKVDLVTKMLESSGRALLIALSDAVGVRVRSIPSRPSLEGLGPTARVAVFFSGGLDSVVIAALAHFHAPATEPVDLLTVCFDEVSNFASPDRRAAELAHAELCTLFPERQWNLVKVNVSLVELVKQQRKVQALMAPCDTHMDFNIGTAFWFLSRGRGVLTKSTEAAEITTLDELNAFLKPHQADLPGLEAKDAALTLFDDKSVNGSALLCPVTRDEASKKLLEQQYVSCFVHRSKQTELPTLSNPTSASTRTSCSFSTLSHYQTNAQVVLVGIGADEQLAGYGRHRTTLINGGEQALRAELNMDLSRIWKRNLGRDDRCIAAHGREARFPYLDETVVSTIAAFPISSLCDADLPRGVGDKRVLRLVAATLGLSNCAGLPKRAIQFGSRIAKVSNTGSSRQTQGENKFSSVM